MSPAAESAAFAGVVATSSSVSATTSRKDKTALIGSFLADLPTDDIVPVVAFLTGEPRQGRIGVGWATVGAVEVSPATESSLTIAAIDTALDSLMAIEGPGSNQRRVDELGALFTQATAAEADFLRRLLIGDLRQGALAGLMADGVAKASSIPAKVVRRAAMLSGDLGEVARLALTSGRDALEAVTLQVLRPVQPMLAATSPDAAAAVSELGACSVEWKLDGIRIQVHRDVDDVLIVTRNLNDVTSRLPAVVDLAKSFPGTSAVLDGEAIWMAGDRPEAFQDTASRFSRETPNSDAAGDANSDAAGDGAAADGVLPDGGDDAALGVRFFDILHRDGADLIDEPLDVRRTHLEAVVGELMMPGEITDEPDRAEELFVAAVEAGHEGVMVKAIDSTYAAGRRGKAWRKVKPVRTLDLVVLAAEWGHGRRQGWLSNLHLGARGADGEFVMVGKTFKGLTDELLQWQTDNFPKHERERRRHVVYLDAHFVVEIALDGVQRSTRYPGGVALRFARVKQYRPDKSPADADTIETVQAL